MTGSNNSSRRVRFGRAALVARLALAATLIPFAAAIAAAAMTLQVETSDTLPGFHRSALPRYLARQMTESLLADWRFEPAANNGSAPDRVEWSFRLNPYAGGDVRSFMRPHMAERTFGVHRPITIEARLYLTGSTKPSSRSRRSFKGVLKILISPRRWRASHKAFWDLRVPFARPEAGGARLTDRGRPSVFAMDTSRYSPPAAGFPA